MNILDENTKTILDAGQVVVLDGGYIVMTPETLSQTVQSSVVDVLTDVVQEQPAKGEANGSFVHKGFQCRFCGKQDDFTEYTVTISGGYASEHDLEQISFDVCGSCLEKMLAAVN